MTLAPGGFDRGLHGLPCRLQLDDGTSVALPVERWRAVADAGDEALLLRHCAGPTVDLGCGPGRLAAALAERGLVALGIDTSPLAVALTVGRGAAALHRDVLHRLPGEGRWSHVLLADGNLGIGGDPVRLLRRAVTLLRSGGSVLAELAPPGTGVHSGEARVTHGDGAGPWFPWARVAADAATVIAQFCAGTG